jgi:hypothetical protein
MSWWKIFTGNLQRQACRDIVAPDTSGGVMALFNVTP